MIDLDVLLVYLPYTGAFMPNLGLACVRATLSQAGYSSRILDLDYSFAAEAHTIASGNDLRRLENMENWVGEERLTALMPLVDKRLQECVETIASIPSRSIGFSINCFNHASTAEVIRRLRTMGDERPVMMGGANCYFPEGVQNISHMADAVVLGEAEETLPEMMPWFLNGRSGDPPQGVLVSDQPGRQTWSLRPPPSNLDTLPFPDYDSQPWPGTWHYPDFPIEMSRSCILSCAFCDVHSRNGSFRLRTPERVIEEIRHLKQDYPGLTLHFNDSLVNGKLPHLRQLCERFIAEDLGVPMVGQAIIRKDMGAEDFRLLGKAGFHALIYGLESGSWPVLQLMNKKVGGDLEKIATCLEWTRAAGIRVVVNLIVGFPGETRTDLEEAADFLVQNRQCIDVVASLSTMAILPGSPVSQHPEKFGVDPRTIHSPSWRTLDGLNTLEERESRWRYLYDRLCEAGMDMGSCVQRMEKPARREDTFLKSLTRKAASLFGK